MSDKCEFCGMSDKHVTRLGQCMLHQTNTECVAALRARIAELEERRTCEWTYDESYDKYVTQCGNVWCLDEGGIKDNNVKYCLFCGGAVIEREKAGDSNGIQ